MDETVRAFMAQAVITPGESNQKHLTEDDCNALLADLLIRTDILRNMFNRWNRADYVDKDTILEGISDVFGWKINSKEKKNEG